MTHPSAGLRYYYKARNDPTPVSDGDWIQRDELLSAFEAMHDAHRESCAPLDLSARPRVWAKGSVVSDDEVAHILLEYGVKTINNNVTAFSNYFNYLQTVALHQANAPTAGQGARDSQEEAAEAVAGSQAAAAPASARATPVTPPRLQSTLSTMKRGARPRRENWSSLSLVSISTR